MRWNLLMVISVVSTAECLRLEVEGEIGNWTVNGFYEYYISIETVENFTQALTRCNNFCARLANDTDVTFSIFHNAVGNRSSGSWNLHEVCYNLSGSQEVGRNRTPVLKHTCENAGYICQRGVWSSWSQCPSICNGSQNRSRQMNEVPFHEQCHQNKTCCNFSCISETVTNTTYHLSTVTSKTTTEATTKRDVTSSDGMMKTTAITSTMSTSWDMPSFAFGFVIPSIVLIVVIIKHFLAIKDLNAKIRELEGKRKVSSFHFYNEIFGRNQSAVNNDNHETPPGNGECSTSHYENVPQNAQVRFLDKTKLDANQEGETSHPAYEAVANGGYDDGYITPEAIPTQSKYGGYENTTVIKAVHPLEKREGTYATMFPIVTKQVPKKNKSKKAIKVALVPKKPALAVIVPNSASSPPI